jgi:hypothetical protein
MYRILILIFFISTHWSFYYTQDTIIDKRTGIEIVFSAKGNIFPTPWYSNKTNGKAVSLDTSEYSRSLLIIKKTLLKYPIQVIQQNLQSIYVLNSLEFFGQAFGGTNATRKVYLSNKGIAKGYSDQYIERLFHAEFSSILLRNYKSNFEELKWLKLNPSGFDYGAGGVAALKKGNDSENYDSKLNKLGFINEYATSSLENDFNSFAKNLFLPKKEFHDVFENNEAINKKRNLIISFYNSIDSSFKKEFFNKLLYTTTY